MTLAVLAVAALVGWCPIPPQPRPPPPKEMIARIIAGILGGICGAYLVYAALGLSGPLSAEGFIALMIGAFAAGKVVQELVHWIVGGPEAA